MDGLYHFLGGRYLFIIKANDNVKYLQTSLIGGAVGNYGGDQRSLIHCQPISEHDVLVYRVELYPQPGADDIAIVNQRLNNRHRGIDTYGVTHALDADGGNGVVASGIAWGNGDNGSVPPAGAGPTVEMSCSSCHNPHGNGQYRILNPIPDPTVLTGLFAAIAAPGALVTDTPVINPATGTADTKNYTILQVKGTPGVTSSYLLYSVQVQAAATAGSFNGIAGVYGPTGGDYFHRFVPWVATTIASRAADAPNGAPSTFTNQMNAWCTACHTRYNSNDPFTARENLVGAPGVEDPIFRYQHQTTPLSDGASCLTCHVSHGSNAVMDGSYSTTMPFPDGNPKYIPATTTIVPDSRLLKFNNRGTCQACHDPTFTVLTGQTTGPTLGSP